MKLFFVVTFIRSNGDKKDYRYVPNPQLWSGSVEDLERGFLDRGGVENRDAVEWLKVYSTCLDSVFVRAYAGLAPIRSEIVQSESDVTKTYVVSEYENGSWSCSCMDHAKRNRDCKHIRAVQSEVSVAA